MPLCLRQRSVIEVRLAKESENDVIAQARPYLKRVYDGNTLCARVGNIHSSSMERLFGSHSLADDNLFPIDNRQDSGNN